jgi:hypothetical protein
MEGRWMSLPMDCRQLAEGGKFGSKIEQERMKIKRRQHRRAQEGRKKVVIMNLMNGKFISENFGASRKSA